MVKIYRDGSFKIPDCDAIFSIIDTSIGEIIATQYFEKSTSSIRTIVLANDTNDTNYEALANVLLDIHCLSKEDANFFIADKLAATSVPWKCRIKINLDLDLEYVDACTQQDLVENQVPAVIGEALHRFVDTMDCDIFCNGYNTEVSDTEVLDKK